MRNPPSANLKRFADNPSIKAIVLRIDSPGVGSSRPKKYMMQSGGRNKEQQDSDRIDGYGGGPQEDLYLPSRPIGSWAIQGH